MHLYHHIAITKLTHSENRNNEQPVYYVLHSLYIAIVKYLSK